jgi:hypothetical protein
MYLVFFISIILHMTSNQQNELFWLSFFFFLKKNLYTTYNLQSIKQVVLAYMSKYNEE